MTIRSFVAGGILSLSVVAGNAVSAATFDFLADYVAGAGTTQSGSSLTFNSTTPDDVTVVVKAYDYANPGAIGSNLDVTASRTVSQSAGYGIWVGDYQDNDHRIDGYGRNEIVTFLFSEAVKVTQVGFKLIADGSVFDFYLGNGTDPEGMTYQGSNVVQGTVTMDSLFATLFGIGASTDSTSQVCTRSYYDYRSKCYVCKEWKTVKTYSAFKITSLTVETVPPPPPPVPLPASGFILVGGLGLLAGLRRRRS